VATERLALTDSGHIRYTLKTPYRDGTTHVMFEPEDFIARLVALVPKPRAHLTRYHGVLAPASALRSRVVPGSGAARETAASGQTEAQRHRAMTWAQRLKRVFAIDIERCRRCGGMLGVIASIEEPEVIIRILAHLDRDEAAADPAPPGRGPPQGRLPI
jgi:Putative transposase